MVGSFCTRRQQGKSLADPVGPNSRSFPVCGEGGLCFFSDLDNRYMGHRASGIV
jgi:hypothetical protein